MSPTTKVLYMSGYTANGVAAQGGLELGEFLQKPFTEESLLHKIREILGPPDG